ncbi:DUF3783 domain-containing protein [Pyrococcus abyssi]|nr:DUF3783 domain-containing protein [Pyrococcus abyssi]
MKIFGIGFSEQEIEELRRLGLDIICIPEYCRDWVVSSIVENTDELEGRCDWHFKKFIIMHNASNEDIKRVIKLVKPKFKDVIFATTTETSLTWRLDDLLQELIREDEYFKRRKLAKGPFLEFNLF